MIRKSVRILKLKSDKTFSDNRIQLKVRILEGKVAHETQSIPIEKLTPNASEAF